MSGFYLMHRGWLDHPAFGGAREPYCRRSAWVWLIEHAKWKDGMETVGGKRIMLRRGQLSYSSRYLAEAWGWDDRKVRRFLAKCTDAEMIVCDTAAGQFVITICNYDEYQISDGTSAAEVPHECRGTRCGSAANKKEGNQGKKESPLNPPSGEGPPDGGPTDRDLLGEEPATGTKRKRSDGGERGTRVPDGDLPDEWAVAANHTRERHQMPLLGRRVLGLRWDSFQNYWRGVTGAKGLKRDWRATWLNDCIDMRTEKRFPPEVATARERPPMIDTTG